MTIAEPITVVSGLPRSGTSLMMQMLAAGGLPVLSDGLRSPDEDNPRGYFELEAVKHTTQDASWLRDAPGRAVKIIHVLLKDLPAAQSYQVIFMRRSIDEVLRSQRVMIERRARPSLSIAGDRLAETFLRQLVQVHAWLDTQPNIRTIEVEYHACVREPLAVATQVQSFLGCKLNLDAMAGVVEPGLHRQR